MDLFKQFVANEQKVMESITFDVAVIEDHPKYGKMYNSAKFAHHKDVDCWVCDGTGKDKYHDRYIDTLLAMIDFAQKNNATISWS